MWFCSIFCPPVVELGGSIYTNRYHFHWLSRHWISQPPPGLRHLPWQHWGRSDHSMPMGSKGEGTVLSPNYIQHCFVPSQEFHSRCAETTGDRAQSHVWPGTLQWNPHAICQGLNRILGQTRRRTGLRYHTLQKQRPHDSQTLWRHSGRGRADGVVQVWRTATLGEESEPGVRWSHQEVQECLEILEG